MSNEEKGLNIRQLKFIDNLFAGMSGKKAYIEAGYNIAGGHSAESAGSRLLRNVEIQKEIDKRKDDIDYRNRIRLRRMSETALAQQLNMLKDDIVKPSIKADIIRDILDRAGLKPVEQSEQSGTIQFITSIPRPKSEQKRKS